MKKRLTILASAVALLALMTVVLVAPVSGCPVPTPPDKCQTELIAGQHWTAGHLEVWDDGTHLHVEYVEDGWNIIDTHLYVGTERPTKAAPGRFPFSEEPYDIAFSRIPYHDQPAECGDVVYIAAHAVVSTNCQSETAWADSYGTPIRENKGWAMYFGYTLCSDDPAPDYGCFEP